MINAINLTFHLLSLNLSFAHFREAQASTRTRFTVFNVLVRMKNGAVTG